MLLVLLMTSVNNSSSSIVFVIEHVRADGACSLPHPATPSVSASSVCALGISRSYAPLGSRPWPQDARRYRLLPWGDGFYLVYTVSRQSHISIPGQGTTCRTELPPLARRPHKFPVRYAAVFQLILIPGSKMLSFPVERLLSMLQSLQGLQSFCWINKELWAMTGKAQS